MEGSDTAATAGMEKQVCDIKKRRATAKGKLSRKMKVLRECINTNQSTEVLNNTKQEMCDCFKEVERLNEDLISLYNDDKSIDECQQYIYEIEIEKCKIVSMCKMEDRAVSSGCIPKSNLVKKLDSPKFSGNIREYPTFVKDFNRLMVSQHGKDPYVLRQSLSGKALATIGGLDEFDQMWERLEDRYGCNTKLIDSIVSDIDNLKPVPEGNNKKMVEMINIIEQAWIDLKKLGRENEIENTVTICKVEKVLPTSIKREWVIYSQSSSDITLFKDLVTFLVRERNTIEYMEEETRSSNRSAAVHSVQSEEDQSALASAIKDLSRSHEQLLERFVNLTETMMNNPSLNVGNVAKYNRRMYNNALKRCWYHGTDNHDILDCEVFKKISNDEKYNLIRNAGICFLCLRSRDHLARNCGGNVCNRSHQGVVCNKPHHPSIHSVFTTNHQMLNASANYVDREGVLLAVGKIKSGNRSLSTLFDPGSNITLITHEAAKKLGIQGCPINLSVTKVGNKVDYFDSKSYKITVIDDNNEERIIEACGINEITSDIARVDLTDIANLFNVTTEQIDRPEGKVDLLIGTDYCTLLPEVIETVDNLQLMKGAFGLCVRGRSKYIKGDVYGLNVIINHAISVKPDDLLVLPKDELTKTINEYFDIENQGVNCLPKCGGCRCGKCTLNDGLTLKEQKELNVINEGLEYDEVNQCWIASYPWCRNPAELPNNVSLAFARLKSTEKRLHNLGENYTLQYQNQMQDMVERGIARKLSRKEMDMYKGPVFYLPHHEILKPGSSTPLRIVFNSSAIYMGHSLNNYLYQGPDYLNNLLGVLLRFRQGQIGLVGDIKKMYNSVKIGEVEQHTHRFLWRDMNVDVDPEHYVLNTVTFGDKPGGAIAMAALRKTVVKFEDLITQPGTMEMINKNSYVDDLLSSIDSLDQAKDLITNVENVLSKGGFHVKEWIMSGTTDDIEDVNVKPKENEKVLGLSWSPENDKFKFKIDMNFCKRAKKGHMQTPILKHEFEDRMPPFLTKRVILSQISSLYDPLGFLTPVTLKAKIMMRNLVQDTSPKVKGKGWDDHVDEYIYKKWKDYFFEMFEFENIQFDRCIKPVGGIGKPDLIIFSDGSTAAYGAVAYVRWTMDDGSHRTRLICSKSRLSPTRQLSIPRIELCGAVLGCRLRKFILQELDWDFGKIFHLIDSEIVKAQINKDSFRFNTFVSNRIAEIQTVSKSCEWHCIPSEFNIADCTTRICQINTLDETSEWQHGPRFLEKDVSEWPLTTACNIVIPDLCYSRNMTLQCSTKTECIPIDITRFNDFDKLIQVTARVLNVFERKSIWELLTKPEVDDIEKAELFWVRNAQLLLTDDWRIKYQRLGPSVREDGIIMVGARIKSWLKTNWNRDEFILLPHNHAFSKLYILHLHNKDHAGVETTLAKLQSRYWIPKARKLIKNVKSSCVLCRKIDKICEYQRMGELPPERLNPSPPFYSTSLDLFGPLHVKDVVKGRAQLKVFGVIFNCLTTRAIYLDIAEGYDKHSFLKVFRRFVAIRGFPKFIYSDRGTQLTAVNKHLFEKADTVNDELVKYSTKGGTVWKFTKSADSPWQNGCAEALIRSVKRCMQLSLGENVLTYAELLTAFFEIANMLNERPIGMKPGCDPDLGTYLCPNDLLLGRSSNMAPSGVWDLQAEPNVRYSFITKVVDCFWKKWNRDYFPTLIIRKKWHHDKRDLQIGDIVLVQDLNIVRGRWRLGEICQVHRGVDNRVRNVTLRYKALHEGKKYVGQKDILLDRPVHKIVVVLPVEEQ